MATVTRLRENRRGRVAVELDGAPWRTLPADVVVRAGLSPGRTLDRPALRLLRRELRKAEALQLAGRALRTRDLSHDELTARLARAEIPPAAAAESVAALERAGLLDDARLAANRAAGLAGRGYGDAAVRHDLERRGVAAGQIEAAIAGLEPEAERAQQIVERRGTGPHTIRYLAGKGFGEDALGAAAGGDFGQDP